MFMLEGVTNGAFYCIVKGEFEMDLIEKCKLIKSNILINNRGYGHIAEIDLEILKELRGEITEELEKIVNPLFEEYKKIQKEILLSEYGMENKDINPYNMDILEQVNAVRRKLSKYFDVLQDIDNRINKIEPQFADLPVIK